MTYADAVADVFKQALVDRHHARRRGDVANEMRFHAVLEALSEAYPREVRPVTDLIVTEPS